MKKALSVLLSIMLIMGMVFSMPLSVSAITVEEMDTDDTMSAFFDFEDKDFMQVGSQSQSSAKVTWQIDPETALEYHYSGWGFSSIGDNPETGETGQEGSVVNSSAKALQAKKSTLNSWANGGGVVVNRKTEKGVEPLILEDNTTYTVEFDYIVAGTHLYGYQVDPDDGTNSATISNTVADTMTFGYGYTTTTSTSLAPVQGPRTVVATIASYKPSVNADGYYTAHDGKEKPIGSWYHVSYTFTTGTFEPVLSTTDTNKPFLIFYANIYTGAHMMVDNIRVSKNAVINVHANGGTTSAASTKGKIGTEITLPTPSRMGYEFTGWYEDGACTTPFTDTYFTKENDGITIYAGWKQGIENFENYVGIGNNNQLFKTVAGEQAYSGNKSLKYSYTYVSYGNPKSSNSYFSVMKMNQAEKTSATYKITFKYYIVGGAELDVMPILSRNASNSTAVNRNIGSSVILSSQGAGKWQTASIVATIPNSALSIYPILSLRVYANANTTTTAYIDDVKITPVESGTGTLTVYGGAGNAAGTASRTVGLAVGDKIDSAFVYNGGYAVEGWYKDSGLTDKVPADVYTSSVSAVYPKFSDRVDLTADGTASRTGGFQKANYEDVLYYNGNSGTASLANVTSGKTYMVEFLYKNNGGSNVTLTAGGGSFVTKSGNNDKWYKGYIPVTATSTDALTLTASGSSTLEIKDVYIKDLTDKVYILFDSTEYGGELTAVYGAAGSAISFPANPIVEGEQFSGWYNGSDKFTATVFPSASVSLKATMVLSSGNVQGDCDGDGVCNAIDLAKMKLYLAKVDTQVAEGADINGDGKVNAIDLVLLYNELL